MTMTHVELHKALDELVACYIGEVTKLSSRPSPLLAGTNLLEFMKWSGSKAEAELWGVSCKEPLHKRTTG
jgi:hypothetical protein